MQAEKCIECGHCVAICSKDALTYISHMAYNLYANKFKTRNYEVIN